MNNKLHFEHLIDKIYPSRAALEKALLKPLTIYHGIDPTGSTIHIGHAVVLRLLKHLQEMGHKVIILIGDFTALIGDPTGRDAGRKMLSEQQIIENLSNYKEQLFKILDPTKTEISFNSQWYSGSGNMSTLRAFLELGKEFTAAQLWERDLFQERQKKGNPVSLTEFIYPVLQAYDSVELAVDLEVGGTDQTFNMLRGRDLISRKLGKEKFVITTKLLSGIDGRKMSKSYDNYVGLIDSPEEMFGKLMSIADKLLEEYFALAADIDPLHKGIRALIKKDPRSAKVKMAREVVALYHGIQAADLAEFAFDRLFKEKALPTDVIEVKPHSSSNQYVVDLLVDLGLASSRSEAFRFIIQNGVRIDNTVITDRFAQITPYDGMVINVGKRKFVKIKL